MRMQGCCGEACERTNQFGYFKATTNRNNLSSAGFLENGQIAETTKAKWEIGFHFNVFVVVFVVVVVVVSLPLTRWDSL